LPRLDYKRIKDFDWFDGLVIRKLFTEIKPRDFIDKSFSFFLIRKNYPSKAPVSGNISGECLKGVV
jgi:hypothetical protein